MNDTPPSELDKWFPRDPSPASQPEKPPQPGVIEGVKRPRPKRYARRWYQIVRKEQNNANPTD